MFVSMSPEEIDLSLAEWRGRIDSASENLLSLEDVITLKRIEGRDGFSQVTLTGITAAQVTPAVGMMRELFTQLGSLTAVIDRAARLRGSLSRIRRYDQTRQEITNLLAGPSIPLPTVVTPLAQRSLVSASQSARATTPDRLLTAMTDAFEATKEVVLAVEAAWTKLEPQLDAALSKVDALNERVRARGIAAPAELVAAREKVETLRQRVLSDPLGASGGFDSELAPLLQNALARIDAAEGLRQLADEGLKRARDLQVAVAVAVADGHATLAAAQCVIADPEGLLLCASPLDAPALAKMDAWLSSLVTAFGEGRFDAVAVGVGRYLIAARLSLDAEQGATRANRAVLNMPSELRGRLSIVKARAARAADATVARLALQAETILAGERPAPLARAAKLVEACEARLRQKIS